MQQFLDPSPRIHLIFAGRGFSWVESFRVGIILGGYFPDGSNPGQLFSWWELSLWELSWVGIFLGVNFPSWNYRVGIIGVAIFRVGVFMLPRGRGGVTNHVYVGTYIIFYLFGSFFLQCLALFLEIQPYLYSKKMCSSETIIFRHRD